MNADEKQWDNEEFELNIEVMWFWINFKPASEKVTTRSLLVS